MPNIIKESDYVCSLPLANNMCAETAMAEDDVYIYVDARDWAKKCGRIAEDGVKE